jgi:hypothetical protein
MCADINATEPTKVFLPAQMQYAPPPMVTVGGTPKKPNDPSVTTMKVLASAAGGTIAVTLLNSWGGPGGLIADTMQALPATALMFGGPLALGVLAAQMLDVDEGNEYVAAAVAAGITVAGMMATNMVPRVVDMATFNTVAAAAVGVYVGDMLC